MLFRKDVEPQCSYCKFGKKLGRGEIGCKKRGILKEYDSCSHFRYDPYKRVPESTFSVPKLTNTESFDFELEG